MCFTSDADYFSVLYLRLLTYVSIRLLSQLNSRLLLVKLLVLQLFSSENNWRLQKKESPVFRAPEVGISELCTTTIVQTLSLL